MAGIGNIRPPKPIWPEPAVGKIKRKEDRTEQERQEDRKPPAGHDDDGDGAGDGIDEYV